MSKWKYFTEEEVAGLKEDVVYKLDRARELFGFPIKITSGYRDPAHNKEIGGVSSSAHTKGMAVDIPAPQDMVIRDKLCWALGAAGFLRFEDAPRHFHVDVDRSKPSPCFWIGDDK